MKPSPNIYIQRYLTAGRVKASWLEYGFGLIMFLALGYQLRHRLEVVQVGDLSIDAIGGALILIVMLLASLNWLLEAVKWRLAMKSTDMPLRSALDTVLVGLSFAVWTPGRVGDYAGRALHSTNLNRSNSILATFMCSAAQLTVSFTLGLISILLMLSLRDFIVVEYSPFLLILPIVLMLWLFFKSDRIAQKLSRWSYFSLINNAEIQSTSSGSKWSILGLALLRYATYTLQMVLLLLAFRLNIPLIDAILGVSILFLVQTLIPLPMLFQVATKIELALLIWAPYDPGIAVLSLIMLTLWMINVVGPSFIGYRLINFKNLQNEQNSHYDYD